jgi:hypothetical protein
MKNSEELNSAQKNIKIKHIKSNDSYIYNSYDSIGKFYLNSDEKYIDQNI